MKLIALLAILIFLTTQLSAQPVSPPLEGLGEASHSFQWAKAIGGAQTDIITGIASQGNDTYITGRFSGNIVSGSEKAEAAAMTDIYLARLNKEGKITWLKTLTGQGANSATCIRTGSENIFIGGIVSGKVSLGKKQFDGEGTAVFISSWTKQGKPGWLCRFRYTGHVTVDVLEIASNGNILTGGLLQGTLQMGDTLLECPNAKRAWTAILSPEGKALSAKISTGEGSHRLISACTDATANTYNLYSISGNFCPNADTLVLIPKAIKSGLVLTKTTNNGNLKWLQTIWGSGYTEGVKVITDIENQPVVCVNFNKKINCGETELSTKSQLETALFVFAENGNPKWQKTISSPVKARTMDMLTTGNGNLLLAGYFRQSYAINNTDYFSETPRGDLFLLQLNNNGETVWHDEPGREAASFCRTFTLDQNGNIIFAGGYKGDLQIQNEKLTVYGKEDILIAKYFNCLQKEAEIIGDAFICDGGENQLSVTGDFSTYVWNDNEWGANNRIINQPGTYTVTAYDEKGCAATDTFIVSVMESSALGLPAKVEVYPGKPTTLSANGGFANYLWHDGLQGSDYEIAYTNQTDSTVVSLCVETLHGCLLYDSVTVHFSHKPGQAGVTNAVIKSWPNPVTETLWWTAKTNSPQTVLLTLTDSKSVNILKKEIDIYIPNSVKSINTTSLASGNYVLTIKIGEITENIKIVKR